MTDLSAWVLLLAFAIISTFFGLIGVFWYSYWFTQRKNSLSPYTGLPLRRATELSYYVTDKVLIYLHEKHQYDNRPFDISKASYCRETGRLFPYSLTLFNTIRVDWSFLQKRFPGSYVSWGSLNQDQQDYLKEFHKNLDGFQTGISCPEPSPRAISPEYAYTKPGPLYVDLMSKVLLGWKEVPGTDLEVLIVQMPIKKGIQ